MDNFIIREAKLEDINSMMSLYGETIWKIEKSIDSNLKNGFESSNELQNLMSNDIHDENTIILVAESGNKIVGYISASIILLEDAYVEKTAILHEIATKDEYQKLGIGKLLLEECIILLKNRKVRYIKLSLFEKNKKAKNFYESNGFELYSMNYRKKI